MKIYNKSVPKFKTQIHFYGYDGRGSDPSRFDCNYTYNLGLTVFSLIANGTTGQMASIKNLEMDFVTIGWYTWALHERPKYKAEAFNPDCKYMGWGVLGSKSIDDVIMEGARKRMGLFPDPDHLGLVVSDSCIIDPQYAPEGKHCLLTETYLQPAWKLSEKEKRDEPNWISMFSMRQKLKSVTWH